MLTKDEKKRIALIKRDLATRLKWSKLDYQDFYFRDVTFLLSIIDRIANPPQQPPESLERRE